MNTVTKSIIYILFSFILFSLTIFLVTNNYSFVNLKGAFKYTFNEVFGLIILISQYIFVIREDNLKKRDSILLNSVIYWLIFLLIRHLFTDHNIIYFSKLSYDKYFIERFHNEYDVFDLYSLDLVKRLFYDFHNWDLTNNLSIASFFIILVNISLINVIKIKFSNNYILYILTFILYTLFLCYLWDNYMYKFFILISYILLKFCGDNSV